MRNKTMVRCLNCNAHSVIRTSWTAINPRRRFYCFSGSCCIIDWYDQPMCPRVVQIIPRLLRSMNELQARSNELQATVNEQAHQAQRLKWIIDSTGWLADLVLANGELFDDNN
ncbi:hypothetical protein Tco_0554546 [Tanacetum coccineum]